MGITATVRAGLLGLGIACAGAGTGAAASYEISVDRIEIDTGSFRRQGVGYNGSELPTILRWTEGEEVTIHVTNNLRETTSIHWHGLILPFTQDGVPGLSFDGIAPGETFTYHFPIVQSGTYWFHSHSGFQEPDGAFGAIIITPQGGEPMQADRDHVVQLSDLHPHRGARVMRNLKLSSDYYNRKQRTLGDLLRDSRMDGPRAALADRAMWGAMRMMPTDIEDVQGFEPRINGRSTEQNWTGLFRPGERVRLRLINSSAMAYFDVRIPGLEMTVIAADGNPVAPVTVDELRIAVAETYDVIVRPTRAEAYSIIAESMGRTALVRGTLAPQDGMAGPVPGPRPAPLLTMADMGMGMDHGAMDHASMSAQNNPMAGMEHGAHAGDAMPTPPAEVPEAAHMPDAAIGGHAGHTMPAADMLAMPGTSDAEHAGHSMPLVPAEPAPVAAGATAGRAGHMSPASGSPAMAQEEPATPAVHAGHAAPDAMQGRATMGGMAHGTPAGGQGGPSFYAPGSGLTPAAANGGRFLSYADLQAIRPLYRDRPPTREIEIRLTGNMERYIWSLDGVKYADAQPIRLTYGERVRFTFVNETMMSHPMHLHGMWSILDTGNGARNPAKHVISVAPGTTVMMETEVDAPGRWAFHCHLAYHMDAGMFREVIVEGGPA